MDAPPENAFSRASRIPIYRAPASPRHVKREEPLAILVKGFQTFRATRWFRITYLVLLGVIVAQLFVFTQSALVCLIVLLIPITVFIVPYWLGERKARNFAGNGFLVFLIAILVASAMSTQAALAQADAVPLRNFPGFHSAPGLNLSDGYVRPYHGTPGQSFTFRVNLTTSRDSTPQAYNVSLNLTALDGFTVSSTSYPMTYRPGPGSSSNPRNGTWYERNVTLAGSVYIYNFAVTDGSRNWTETVGEFGLSGTLGPITASGWAFYGFFLYLLVLNVYVTIEFLFYIGIVFLFWYTRKARERMIRAGPSARGTAPPPERVEKRTAGETRAAKAAAFTCTNCGADVTEADKKCPSCGAEFED